MAERKSCEILRAADWIVEGASCYISNLFRLLSDDYVSPVHAIVPSLIARFSFSEIMTSAAYFSRRYIAIYTQKTYTIREITRYVFSFNVFPPTASHREAFPEAIHDKRDNGGASETEWMRDRERRSRERAVRMMKKKEPIKCEKGKKKKKREKLSARGCRCSNERNVWTWERFSFDYRPSSSTILGAPHVRVVLPSIFPCIFPRVTNQLLVSKRFTSWTSWIERELKNWISPEKS